MRLWYAELVSENPLEFFENHFANKKLVPREHELQDVMTEPASREGRDQNIGVHIMAFQYGLRDMPTVANRAVEILVKMFNLADAWGWRPSGRNPCRFVRRYKVEKHHERFLTPEELYRLGRALDAAPAERLASTHAAAAIRLLVLTGCRRNEVLGLRWEDLDFEAGEMRLADSKTGARVVPLPPAAARVLAGLSRFPGNPWVFPGRKKGDRQHSINDSWDRVRERAGLDGCAFMTCDTPSLRGHWRSGRACR